MLGYKEISCMMDIIKDMYDGAVANVRTCGNLTSDFSIIIGLHQGFYIEFILVCYSDG